MSCLPMLYINIFYLNNFWDDIIVRIILESSKSLIMECCPSCRAQMNAYNSYFLLKSPNQIS